MSADPTAENIDAHRIEFCTCPEGVYSGAQMVGTTPRCERCGFLPNWPWVHADLAASLPAEVMLAALVDRGWCATCLCPPLSCAGWLVLGNRKCCPDCSHAEVAP